VLNHITYAIPAWEPFLSVAPVLHEVSVEFLKRSFRYGFKKNVSEVRQLLDNAMYDLFTYLQIIVLPTPATQRLLSYSKA